MASPVPRQTPVGCGFGAADEVLSRGTTLTMPQDLIWLELAALVGVASSAWLLPRPLAALTMGGLRGLARLAACPGRAELACFVLAFAGAAATAWLVQWPEPRIHDEFSYLLAADTFAHGRLTNPAHTMWEHFEAFHTLSQPTYASKYPPGQGLMLAAGQLLTGQPVVGLWLSVGLLAAAMVWMLRVWTRPGWATFGGLLTALLFGVASHWSQTFWGGAVAATGAALVFGALPRICATARTRDAVTLGLGIAVLLNTRPFEGGLVVLVVGVALLIQLVQGRVPWRVLPPLALVLALTALWMGYYNWRVTGDSLRLPYVEHESQYAVAPALVFQSARPVPEYANHEFASFWAGYNFETWERQCESSVFFQEMREKLRIFWRFHLGLVLSLPLLCLPLVLRHRKPRFALAILGLVVFFWLFSVYPNPHYIAPITPLAIALLVLCLRRLGSWRPGARPVGRALILGLFLVTAAQTVAQVATRGRDPDEWQLRRAAMNERLGQQGGKHVVFVDTAVGYPPHIDWVANGADLDNAPVLWVRDRGHAENRALLKTLGSRSPLRLRIGYPSSDEVLVPAADLLGH